TYHHGIAHEFLFFNNLQNGKARGTSQVVAAKCGTQLKMFGLYMGCDDDARYRESVAHAFGHAVNIGIYTREIMTEKLSGTAIAALHAVGNINGAMLIAKRADQSEETVVGDINSAHTLYAFNNYRRNFLSVAVKAFL